MKSNSKPISTGYIPKEMYKLTLTIEDLESPIRWVMTSPSQMSLSFTMYYEGGQWRFFRIKYNLKTFDYSFSCTYYYPDQRKAMGEEITKEEWDKLGHTVSRSKNAAAEVIPPNDICVLKWLKEKNVLVELKPERAEVVSQSYMLFEQQIREYNESNKAYDKQQFHIIIQETLTRNDNIDRFSNYIKENPTDRILNLDEPCFLQALTMNQMKTSQINPEHLFQIKQTFYGAINVDTI